MNKKHVFLHEVLSQIKSKEAKKYVADELSYHLKEAKNEWIEKGLLETEAEEKAIKQMGSPVILGQQLNKLHRPKVDWILVILLLTIFGLGFLPMFSIGGMGEYLLTSKVVITLIGCAATLGIMLIDYRKLKKQGWLFYLIGVFILLVLRLFSNTMINGLPFLRIGPLTIETIMSLPFFFLAWASLFSYERLKVWQFSVLFLLPIILFSTVPSMSTTYIYTIMVFTMLWWSKFSRKMVLWIWGVSVSFFLLVSFISWMFLSFYQKDRLLAYLNPEKYSDGPGFMILRVKELLSKAGWFGNSMNNEFIPEAHTNLVLVSFTYYYGWLFAIALVLILFLFGARIIAITSRIKDSYGRLLLIGAVALYTVQLATNIGMTLGIFPLISMSLPFISYGLMPTLLNAILIGIVLSVFRRKDLTSKQI
ncbi:FtsW/RodA/SpoVE family cell cycle protein [Bacillus sp. sid0103]|uniref:FtsW/RodA/SpoVE family cell cycle protein n=1 Tax=Bacillus sp. sid0103 TaxID=2856337 RepID=UPI001C478EBA|nr:FtsW/RodA/SpoVE family cell cycle protein [Bacillus sp. sid0103]MBV7506746.1 FtsW/RodA/SpoVE family cell cycle protein [Bacillus sp. sid0103]